MKKKVKKIGLITGPKFGGEGGVRRGSAKSPNLTFFFEAFPKVDRLVRTCQKSLYKSKNDG